MKNALTEIFCGVKSLFVGMKITLGQFFKPTITLRYPHQSLKMAPRFRGHIELVLDPATGKPKCFVCKLCEKACPSDCITVEGIKPEGARRKTVTQYRLDFTKCSLCGTCVEACRDGAIRYSHDYNLASTNKDDFVMDLFKRLETEMRTAGTNPEKLAASPTHLRGEPANPLTSPSSTAALEKNVKAPAAAEPSQSNGLGTISRVEHPKPEPPRTSELQTEAK